MRTLSRALLAMPLHVAFAGSAAAIDVGYYDMGFGQGVPAQVPPIVIAGETPVLLTDLSAADLAGIEVLFVQNPSNGSYGFEYLNRLTEIEAAVAGGMTLIIHDRLVDTAETILPGGAGFAIVRETSGAEGANIDILDNTTLVTNGPGGILDDTSLDGGNLSNHGFTVAGSLPGDATLILSRTDPSEIVTMCYGFEGGAVVYSTIPLDFYLSGFGSNPPRAAMAEVYAPNVVAYAAEGPCGNLPPECEAVSAEPGELWPPNHKFADVSISGVTDPDGDPVTLTVTGIRQDEPVEGFGDGNTCPDALGVGTDVASVRVERSGTKKTPGDGRVYHISFTAEDGQGGECSETVAVCVPHDQRPGDECVDQGAIFDSADCTAAQ